jgi:ATP-dependent RNA helicase SUPV3L1/SUV3
MLLCGFEKFDNYFVRIDILERLFVQIINANPDGKKEIKLIPEMLNLLGSNKDNFLKLIQKMNYKTFEKNNEFYFKYAPIKKITKKINKKNKTINNPFGLLKTLNFK